MFLTGGRQPNLGITLQLVTQLKEKNMKDLSLFTDITVSEQETISGGGWFKKLTGISTPEVLQDLDKTVRKEVPGGWVGVAIKAGELLL